MDYIESSPGYNVSLPCSYMIVYEPTNYAIYDENNYSYSLRPKETSSKGMVTIS